MGRHPTVCSLVLPIADGELRSTAAWQALERELRTAPFARKIGWDLVKQRSGKLHATVCGSLSIGTPDVAALGRQLAALQSLRSFAVELRGLFSGNINVGRLYLRVYPECRDGENMLRAVQRLCGCRETDMYLVGVWNLVDDLDGSEREALHLLIERWWDRTVLRFQVRRLWLLAARDDLVLDSEVLRTFELD